MKPMSPVIPGMDLPEVVYAKDQDEYIPLPACRTRNGVVVTRWRPTVWERLRILFTGNLWLSVWTFNKPLQPVRLDTKPPLGSGQTLATKQGLAEIGT